MGDMPAKIWALPGITRGYWSPAPSKHPNSAKIAYIRADLVEPLVEALIGLLKDYLAVFEDHPEIEPNWKPNDSFLVQKARVALQAYEAAQ